jgi:DNA-binding response OmpR family regulator
MKRTNILVAEDDTHIRNGLSDALTDEGYEVTPARNGEEALKLFRQGECSLVILDVMMPGMSGFDVCREIRKRNAGVPILFLTAKSEEIDKVIGLELGADDYLTKPFGVREMLARVAALLRRARHSGGGQDRNAIPEDFVFGGARVDRKRHVFFGAEGEIPLTAREMKLVQVFYLAPGETLSRNVLLDRVWGVDYVGTTRTLDQHVAQLRKKIEPQPESPRFLHTVHGVGYRYDPPV